jgi:hypothetical protein
MYSTRTGYATRLPSPRCVGGGPRAGILGQITRHRLSRGGDRAANNALYRVALVRMSAHPQTGEYAAHHDANGRTKKRFFGYSNELSLARCSDC